MRPYANGDLDASTCFAAHPEYARTFVAVLRDFMREAHDRGWGEAGLQVFLNNKGDPADPTKCFWTLDEPATWWDYHALAYYGGLVREARHGSPAIRLDYRIDISRPEFARGELDGVADLWVVNQGAFDVYRRLVFDRARATGERIWTYGSTNVVDESNRRTAAWVLRAFRDGATGVVPWQTIDKDGKALREADQLGLFIFAREGGSTIVRRSLRLGAYLRAEQDVEYLLLLRERLGLSDAQLRAFIDRYVRLDGAHRQRGADDAGAAAYGDGDPEGMRQLREAAAMLLEAATP
jgi:hypothetical protein